ncbi:hypothetical protein [Novosphingobium sp. FKTRR1]|uniref:hypothetical protein n=1 Tax=Novosphingobium sp. FKTRR1 TaxID=2879118 RepID=UPI001CF006BC|nr:hypothetical protein [Novosphingobium sp. FKTRR1]
MHAVRAFFLSHRRLALLVIAAALCVKALVPAGYMPGSDTRTITVQVCADSIGHVFSKQIVVGQTGKAAGTDKSATSGHCAFSALGQAALGGADPLQLALALLFIVAAALAPLRTISPRRNRHHRPPLRGPPTPA